MRKWICLIFLVAFASLVRAAEVMPPAPSQYVNDYAGVLNNASSLNQELDQFERQSSNQIVVAIYPKMQSDSSIDDYTLRIANNWRVGQSAKNNGAILFVFIQDHQMFIQTGKGMEGALPDAICKRIIDQEIKPDFKQGDFSAGVAAGVHAMMAASRGEYSGNGRTAHGRHVNMGFPPILLIIIILCLFSFLRRSVSYATYGRRRHWYFGPGFYVGGWGGGGGSSWGGGNWGGGGGGGGFSGGGGSFGGGGAGGSW